MTEVVRGNFTPRKRVNVEPTKEDLSTRFEREALKRLGGSIAFVSKKKFLFGVDGKAAGGRSTTSAQDGS